MVKRLLVLFAFLLAFSPVSFAKSLTFAQLSDIHYSPNNTTSSKRDVSVAKKHLYFAIQSLNRKSPAFTVFLGDQIDKSNEESIKDFMGYTSKLNMPYYLTFGNHDAYKMSGISKDDYLDIVTKTNSKQPYKRYYTFKANKDVIGIVLDGSAQLAPTAHGYFSPEQLAWLDKQLTKNKKKLVLIFQHFPLIPPREHKSHEILQSENYWNILKKHNNVVLISSGHYHSEGFSVDEQGIRHISTTSLLNTPPTYDLVTIKYEKKTPAKDVKVDVEHVKF